MLNDALGALEETNIALAGVVQHIDFNRKVGQRSVTDKSLQQLIDHFSRDESDGANRGDAQQQVQA